MREALMHIVQGVEVKHSSSAQQDTTIWRDAKLIEKAMAGMGTKDAQLIWRCIHNFHHFQFLII